MKFIKFLALGAVFGVILIKSEAASWYRIFEMFNFHSFHMYGIIGSAVSLGVIAVAVIKKRKLSDYQGQLIKVKSKDSFFKANLIGGIIFGLGWALAGACPGPMFSLLGFGLLGILVVIGGSLLGTYIYGVLKDKLPH